MQKTKLPNRSEVMPENKWQIEDIYKNDTLWQTDYNTLVKEIPSLKNYKNTLQLSAKHLFDCLEACDKVSLVLDKLYVYAAMRFHEDSANSFYQGLTNQAESLVVEYSAVTSFIVPEILDIPEDKMAEFQKQSPEKFSLYAHFLENIQRQKKHTLSPTEEALLAQASELTNAPQTIFTMLNDADIKFPMIKNEQGEEMELTKGRYTTFLESKDRTVRKNAFQALYATYAKQKNTLASIYNASVKADVFTAKARHYDSSIAAALGDDNIPLSVYDNLIETVHKHLPLLHKYIALRKKILKLDELHMYDLYVPLTNEADTKISYEAAKTTVIAALEVMGKEYTDALKMGLESGWIDVYENQGKRGGAYSWGTYSVHPYVLLNHNDNVNSMFTLAHEMGHALHSYFSWQKQPYLYGGHKIFVAEVASTCNEALLIEHLLKTTDDKAMKFYLINYFLEQFRGTFFRQTMFAEFEKITHEMAEAGEALTCETLNCIYRKLNEQYFGNELMIDSDIDLEWARIPHFYNAFYVYQYATGYSAAIALSRKIITEGKPAIDRYLDFLSKGNSEYSIDLLKGAGVDMTTTKPAEEAMSLFKELLDQLENFE